MAHSMAAEGYTFVLVHRKIYLVFWKPRSARFPKNKMLQNLGIKPQKAGFQGREAPLKTSF
jgi:hypothetical protein